MQLINITYVVCSYQAEEKPYKVWWRDGKVLRQHSAHPNQRQATQVALNLLGEEADSISWRDDDTCDLYKVRIIDIHQIMTVIDESNRDELDNLRRDLQAPLN